MNELFRQAAHGDSLFRYILALLIISAAIYMILATRPVPEWFQLAFGTVVVFYFGSGAVSVIRHVMNKNNGETIT